MSHKTTSLKSIMKPPKLKVLVLIVGLVVTLGLVSMSAPAAYANPEGPTDRPAGSSGDELLSYCRKVAKQGKAACSSETFANTGNSLITAAINVASYHCTNLTQQKEQACIVKTVKEYFDKAAKKNHSHDQAFKAALQKVLKDAKGSMKVPSPKTSIGGANSPTPSGADPAIKECNDDRCDFIGKYVNPTIKLLTAVFGLVAVASLIIGGIQYSASAGDPQKVTQAKKRILNTIVAIVAYFFLFGFLQFLIPGGLFNRG